MVGIENSVVVAKNVNFDYTSANPHTGVITTGGDLLIGTGTTPVEIKKGNLLSNSLTIAYANPNITIETSGGGEPVETLTPNEDFDGSAATPIAPQTGNINILGSTLAAATVTETFNSTGTATGDFEVEHRAWLTPFVVDSSTTPGARGTFSTIQAAINAASSGQTVFLRPGTYTENLTLKAGVDLVGFDADALTPNVTIVGNSTATFTGTASLSGIRLRTNSAALLTVSGSNATNINLQRCYLDCTNNTGITFSSSNASARIRIEYCRGDLGTTGIALFAHSSAGRITTRYCTFTNTGGSTTSSTCSAGVFDSIFSTFQNPITTSGTATLSSIGNVYTPAGAGLNATAMTMGGSGNHGSGLDIFSSGTASALSIGNTALVNGCIISSTNTNAITGAGTIIYNALTFSNTSSTINTTTQIRYVFDGGEYKGRTNNTTPSAGMLGETISSTVASGSAVTLTPSGTAVNITSINLTAGIWDVNILTSFTQTAAGTASSVAASISTTSATHGTEGNNRADAPPPTNSITDQNISIPQYRLSLSAASTTVYMVGSASFSSGTIKGFGRISAVRVA